MGTGRSRSAPRVTTDHEIGMSAWSRTNGAHPALSRVRNLLVLADLPSGGDLSGLRSQVGSYLESENLFMDADQVLARVLSNMAFGETVSRGARGSRVTDSIRTCVSELLEEGASAGTSQEPDGSLYAVLARQMQLDPGAVRGACHSISTLPDRERRSFTALLLDEAPLEDVGSGAGSSLTEMAQAVRAALLAAIAGLAPAGVDDQEGCAR